MDLSSLLSHLSEKSKPKPVSKTEAQDELQKVTQEIYERNVDLSIRNRTFAILQKLYTIINTSLGVEETAQRVINTVVAELQFKKGAILLYNPQSQELVSFAVSDSNSKDTEVIKKYNYPFKNLRIKLNDTNNHCVEAYLQKKEHMTNSLSDILCPYRPEKEAEAIEIELGIQTTVLFPLIFADRALGILSLSMDKHVGFLSRAEKEILKEVIEIITIAIERSQIYADLKTANERLKEVDKLKDEFVSIASHELRTPMTAIKSYLWMALAGKGGDLTEKQKYYLDRAYNSTDRLIKLVNDMLNISRIESGRMSFTMKEVDLISLVETVVGEVRPRADELSVTVEIDRPSTTIPHVLADEDKIDEVLINLIGNSLKFTNPGGKITISFVPSDAFVTVSVHDTGAGIEPEDMPKLFSKFGLLPGSYINNRNVSLGTGLGLYICKNIIDIHGGEIKAESPGRNQGSTFSFSLSIFSQQKMDEFNAKYSKDGGKGIEHMQL